MSKRQLHPERTAFRKFSDELFLAIKHGKKRHRNWLERKMKRFTENYVRRKHDDARSSKAA